MSNVEHVLTAQDELGECPLWDSAEQALYWVDIEGNRVHRYEPATGSKGRVRAKRLRPLNH